MGSFLIAVIQYLRINSIRVRVEVLVLAHNLKWYNLLWNNHMVVNDLEVSGHVASAVTKWSGQEEKPSNQTFQTHFQWVPSSSNVPPLKACISFQNNNTS